MIRILIAAALVGSILLLASRIALPLPAHGQGSHSLIEPTLAAAVTM